MKNGILNFTLAIILLLAAITGCAREKAELPDRVTGDPAPASFPAPSYLPSGSVELSLTNRDITDETLAQLVGSGRISGNTTRLYLACNQISDVSALRNLTNLIALCLHTNQISKSQINELKSALPNCDIQY